MFALRGIAVSFTAFVLLYCCLSALVAVGWRWLKLFRATGRRLAALLFGLRVLPFAAAMVITGAFVVPSFQLLEPRSVDEGIGALPIALGVCGLLLVGSGIFRVIAVQTRTFRAVARWLTGAHPLYAGSHIFAFRSRREAPPLTLVGVCRPRVLISDSAVAQLSREELHIALKHEVAHMRSHDNFKKLVFRFCPFPGMGRLESAWSQSAELAADDAAVSNLKEAVDLAAALVKLSRLLPVEASPICTVGFVTGSISARVARLLAWNGSEAGKAQTMRMHLWYAIPPVLVALLCVFATYGPALAVAHEVTEWLVR
jgi:Zn-dependent protease with chaperone function